MASFCPPTMRTGSPDRHTGGPQKPRSPPTGASRLRVFLAPPNLVRLVVNRGVDRPAIPDIAAVHALGVERQGECTRAVDRDDSTHTPERAQLIDDGPRRSVERLIGITQACGNLETYSIADKEFPVTGRRDRAARIVCIGAGANDGAVADAARRLAGPAAGRSGGRKVAVAI